MKRAIALASCAISGPDRLERDVLVQLAVLGLVELAHAAAGDEADDAEAIGDDLAVSEGYGRGREHGDGAVPHVWRAIGHL